MARSRKRNTGSDSNTQNTNDQGGHKMAGLTAADIQALLSKTRTKGQYVVRLNEFIESGEMGICVNEQWVEFADKKATTLKQGFDNARDNKEANEASEFVKVISNEDKVYLVNLQVAGQELGEEAVAA